ncbi:MULTISPECIES: hypothetical protein [Mammaliicoccus]|uniref:Uncharacterized protein n=1 Tax=Mammaliicoccus sciuri TaxID=1296 RepID=A0AB37HSA6_MAMSC|nr:MULTISPECIES: hypothetical protein [Mammaliicoccus]EZX25874.1 hypothetical protein V070_00372 [Staphylococcus aureus C0673]MBF9296524.1 hypothetical protein [Staphylococcus schleiferi]MBN4908440.1 hypothetical protein [Staphylococcus sp. EG-SA-13]ARB40851.1 hypothetical protein B5728_09375 [Mammaliicoccus sciuri]MCD8795862.1 hypothetical protein [Mammaliicoccus sciuri]
MFFDKKIIVFENLENKYNQEEAKNIFLRHSIDYDFITISSQSIILGGLQYPSAQNKEQFIADFNDYLGN